MNLSVETQTRLQQTGLAFLSRFLEVELERYPDNLEALVELGQAYTQQGRYTEGLAVDRRLAGLLPDNPTVHYNLACSLALLGHTSDAIDALQRSIELGYDDVQFMLGDDDLDNLRNNPRFLALVERLADASRG